MIYCETILSFLSKNISNLLTIHARTRGIYKFYLFSKFFFPPINLLEYSLANLVVSVVARCLLYFAHVLSARRTASGIGASGR